MFSYQMVIKELDQVFHHTALIKSASWDACVFSQQGNEQMTETKLNDLKARIKETQSLLKDLDAKMEFLKSQS